MDHRRIGRSDLKIAPLVLGGNVFGWTADRTTSFTLLDMFLDRGFNAIDTADAYSCWVSGHVGGESESMIGEWLHSRDCRSRVIIATKVGAPLPTGAKGLSSTHIINSVNRSLDRLRTDYIDLYQSHINDPDTPIEETLEAYNQLMKSGKVRVIGASNYPPASFSEALDEPWQGSAAL